MVQSTPIYYMKWALLILNLAPLQVLFYLDGFFQRNTSRGTLLLYLCILNNINTYFRLSLEKNKTYTFIPTLLAKPLLDLSNQGYNIVQLKQTRRYKQSKKNYLKNTKVWQNSQKVPRPLKKCHFTSNMSVACEIVNRTSNQISIEISRLWQDCLPFKENLSRVFNPDVDIAGL